MSVTIAQVLRNTIGVKLNNFYINSICSEFMVTVTLTAVATAIATTLWTKAQEKIGENIGDATWALGGKLIELLRQKNKSLLLTSAVEGNEPQRLDYGQAVLELTEAAQDPEIAQAVVEVEAAVNNNQSEIAKEIKNKAAEIQSQPSVINNFAKLAEEIKAEKGAMVAQQINIEQQSNTYN